MSIIWLLTEQEDYEQKQIHSAWKNKPSKEQLIAILQTWYGNMNYEVVESFVDQLHLKEQGYFLFTYTWKIEEVVLHD